MLIERIFFELLILKTLPIYIDYKDSDIQDIATNLPPKNNHLGIVVA